MTTVPMFQDFPASWFPFTITAYPVDSTEDNNPVWSFLVKGPGVIQIPSAQDTGQRVRIVMVYADGHEERSAP